MARVDVEMPQMGESVMEGTVIEWTKSVGDQIEEVETLLEIATDKVDTEIPSPQAGTLVEILAEEDETVEVGQVIAIIETDAEAAATAETSTDADEEDGDSDAKEETEGNEQDAAGSDDSSEDEEQEEGERIEVEMPKMGESVMEGTVIEWTKNIGDQVEEDETLLEIA